MRRTRCNRCPWQSAGTGAPDPHRLVDVLQLLRTVVNERAFNLVADVFMDGLRNADAAGIGDLL